MDSGIMTEVSTHLGHLSTQKHSLLSSRKQESEEPTELVQAIYR